MTINSSKMVLAASLISLTFIAGCVEERLFNNGPVISQNQLDLAPVGSSQEQVLLALGSPSSVGQFGNNVYYYISQKRSKRYDFQKPTLVDQRVVSIYFDKENTVKRIADYGLKDGVVFDFISRTTPTGGEDFGFLRQILTGKATPSSAIGQSNRSVEQPF